MFDHRRISRLIPFHVMGTLPERSRRQVEAHLSACPACRADADLWAAVAANSPEGSTVSPPAAPLERALAAIEHGDAARPAGLLRRAFELVRAQVPLIRREVLASSVSVVLFGAGAAVLTSNPLAVRFLAPLAAAAGLILIAAPDNDPGRELVRSTAASTDKVLLARLTLVSCLNLALAAGLTLLARAAGLGASFPPLVADWLAPMAFLSAAGLVMSFRIGTPNATVAAAVIWLVRFLPRFPAGRAMDESLWPLFDRALGFYRSFWRSPVLLFALSAVLFAAAMRWAARAETGPAAPAV